MAKLMTKYEFAGSGCLVQGIGLVALFFWPVGTIIGIGLMIYGSIMSKRFKCGNCMNKIEDAEVKICPTCKEPIE